MSQTKREYSVLTGRFWLLAAMFFVLPFLFCHAAPDSTAPSTPSGLQLSGKSGAIIDLSWTASSDDIGVVGYAVYRNGSQVGTSLSTSYRDNSASSSASYSYTVAAYDAASNISPQSVSLAVTTGNVFYVSTSGNNSSPGTFSSPWLSWDKAITTAMAGDIVYFRAGTYQSTVNNLETANSGTASSPVIIKAYPGESPIITANGTQALVIVENPFWVFDGLRFEMSNLPDHDKAMIRVSSNDDASNLTIKNCTFRLYSSVGKDNVACIILQSNRSNNALIQNNEFFGFSSSTNPVSEAAGVQYLGGTNVGTKILDNVFHDLKLGVYVKHANSDTAVSGAEIAGNYFYDCYRSLYGQPTFINFHDNLAVGCSAELGDNGGGAQGRNSAIDHNTFYNSTVILQNPSEGPIASSTITNNIFMEEVWLSPWAGGSLLPHDTILNNNLYKSGTSTFLEYGNTYSLAAWISYYGGSSGSLTGLPVFSSPSPSVLADFVLDGGSAGKNAASDGKDIGADISLVGIKTPAAVDSTPPSGSILINNDSQYSSTTSVSLSLSASDSGSVAEMKISNNPAIFSTLLSWPFVSNYSWILPVIDGAKTVYVWFRDGLGNWNDAPYSDAIILDTLAPSISSVTILPPSSNSVSISWETSEAAVGYVNYGYSSAYVASTSEELVYNTVHSMVISNLSRSTTYNFQMVATDHAGNVVHSTNYYFTTASSAVQDITPPARIISLIASDIGVNSARLSWMAPGDDGNSGLAFSYDMRYSNWMPNSSSTPLEVANWWNNAHQMLGEPLPHSPGTIEFMNISSLLASTTYHFALKTVDEIGNISPLSNIVTAVTTSTSSGGNNDPSSENPPPNNSSGGSSSASSQGSSGGLSTVSSLYIPSFWAIGTKNQILLYWQNPTAQNFFKVKLYRKAGSFQKKENDSDAKLLYDGVLEKYVDTGLGKGETYYYSLYPYDRNLVPAAPRTLQASTEGVKATTSPVTANLASSTEPEPEQQEPETLVGVKSAEVEKITEAESSELIDVDELEGIDLSEETKKIYEKILALSKIELSGGSKRAIANFIHNGTPTTHVLGAGERGGSIASFNNAFSRLPESVTDWQDVIKIANGRWPKQRNVSREKWISTDVFYRIYGRNANMNNQNDNAAVTIICYGLRPALRNFDSEKAGINAFKYIARRAPASTQDWDIVRAIAYSGARR